MRRIEIVVLVAAAASAACVPDYTASTSGADGATEAGPSDASEAGDAGHTPDTGGGPSDARDAADTPDSAPDASGIVCHSGGGATYSFCAVGAQACCGVFAAVPDFCVPFPDTNDACKSGSNPTALVSCDDPSQCGAGEVCCAANLDLNAKTYTAIACAPQGVCNGTSGVACGTVLGAPNSAACTGGTSCTGFVDLYRFCM